MIKISQVILLLCMGCDVVICLYSASTKGLADFAIHQLAGKAWFVLLIDS